MRSTDSALATNEYQYRHELHKRGKNYTKKIAGEFARYDLTGKVGAECPDIVKDVLGIKTEPVKANPQKVASPKSRTAPGKTDIGKKIQKSRAWTTA